MIGLSQFFQEYLNPRLYTSLQAPMKRDAKTSCKTKIKATTQSKRRARKSLLPSLSLSCPTLSVQRISVPSTGPFPQANSPNQSAVLTTLSPTIQRNHDDDISYDGMQVAVFTNLASNSPPLPMLELAPESSSMACARSEPLFSPDFPSHPFYVGEEPNQPRECIEDADNEHYRMLRCERFNLVLDSVCPNITPHIVITPADPTGDDGQAVAYFNGVGLQWESCLSVPRVPYYHTAFVTHPPSYYYPSSTPPSTTHKQVFNRATFDRNIEHSSDERMFMYHVIAAVQKRCVKASAIAASQLASARSSRYLAIDFFANVEKPFVWVDAAEPILAYSKHMYGTLIIDSVCPLVAPHIIINTAPSQSPWIAYSNSMHEPQDGSRLMVNGHCAAFYSNWRDAVGSSGYDQSFDFSSSSSSCASDDVVSRPETPAPQTPEDGDEDFFFVAEMDVSPCTSYEAEEEDDLPEFDDWYQTIAKRASAV